jgi:hypothetical protein
MMKRHYRLSTLLVGLSLTSGCAFKGGDIGDPIHRKFHWFSFVAGDDIAASCEPGLPDRARLVYNAVWGEQVRVYEWDSVRRLLRIRVFGAGDLRGATLSDPVAGWRASEATVQLTEDAIGQLTAALAQDGGFGPPAVGQELPARSYYWSAATCRQGRFTFTGWKYPSPAFAGLGFPALLAGHDPARDTIRPAAPIPVDVMWEYDRNRGAVVDFSFRVGASGMVR